MKHCGQPAAYVLRDLRGTEWFACEVHADPGAADVRWIVRTTLVEWFQARSMPVPEEPRRVCNEAAAS